MEKLIFDAYMSYGDNKKIHFEIETDDLEAAESWQDDIVCSIVGKPVFCNDLTGTLWMYDQKLSDRYWLTSIHPSNDFATVRAKLCFVR